MLKQEALNHELGAGLSFSSAMSGVSLFFTGIIISQYDSFDESIRVPIVFLIIATFSFIFAAAIYSNAGSEITQNNLTIAERYLIYSKNLVEVSGLYMFILATPMVLAAVTDDLFLQVTTSVIALGGFALYSQSRFSIMHKELKINQKRILSSIIFFLALTTYMAQEATEVADDGTASFTFIASELALALVALTVYFSLRSRRYMRLRIRAFRESDAEDLIAVMNKNIGKASEKHFSAAKIKAFQKLATKADIKRRMKTETIEVATFDGVVAGMVSYKGNKIINIFTDPEHQRNGVGRMLIEHAEEAIDANGHEFCEVTANVATKAFYGRMGFKIEKETGNGSKDLEFLMRKKI